MPSAASNSTLYTSSYLTVQEPSPPLSSPQPSLPGSSSLEQTHERLDTTTLPTLRPSRSSTCSKQTATSKKPVNPVRQSEEAPSPDTNGPGRRGTRRWPAESRVLPRASQPDPSSQKAKARQTTKLVNVLIRNKALLSDCIAEDEDADNDNLKMIMRKISAAVKDQRFQSWRQVKTWMMKQYHRRQRSSKTSSWENNSSVVPIRTAFKKHLVPVISTAKMNVNAQKFLKSVIEAIGTRRLTRVFRHRLVRDDILPEDINQLIFSPLFLKTFEGQVRRVKSATLNSDDSTDDSESELSDWEEEDEEDVEAFDESVAMESVGSQVLPSIEQKNGTGDAYELVVTGEEVDEPSTPVVSQEREICITQERPKRKAQHKLDRDVSKAGCKDDERGGSRKRSPLPSMIEDPAHRSIPDEARAPVQVRIQGQATEGAHPSGREPVNIVPPALTIRPFSGFRTPALSEPLDPETESILRLVGLLHNTDEQTNPALPVRETPAILRAENQRQGLKLAKPLAPTKIPSRPAQWQQNCSLAARRAEREIRPSVFYNSSTSSVGRIQLKHGGHKPRGSNNAAQDIPPQCHIPSRENSPSDDEMSLPSLEEIYGPLLTRQGHSTETRRPAMKATKTEGELISEPLIRRDNKKRVMGEENTTSKRLRSSVDSWSESSRDDPHPRPSRARERKLPSRYR